MSELYSLSVDDNTVTIKGELTFASVNAALLQSKNLFDNISNMTIDLAGVERSDSAGLTLLIHWIDEAKSQNRSIYFQNIPNKMMMIANASSVDAILPIR